MHTDRSQWPVRRFASFGDMTRQQIRDWQACTPDQRFDAAWELVEGVENQRPQSG